jgi:hypothetical protein
MYVRLLRQWSPWSPADALRWALLGVLGTAVAVLAWWAVAHEPAFDHQVGWSSIGVAGFILAAYADVSWLLRARNAILARREAILPADDLVLAAAIPSTAATAIIVGGPRLERFHRADCTLAAGKAWPVLERASAVAEGRRPCGVCAP